MNRILILVLVFILHGSIWAQQKKALIVAIGHYPKSSGFNSINSTNDIPLIQNSLLKLGFKVEDIKVLKEETATKKNIINALQNDLLNSIKSGDIAYFHFSGHGQQVADTNGDELDGLDESLVAYDASIQFTPGVYEGQNHITDDELNELLSKIRIKLGPKGHLLTTFDACHSGTGTRHIGIARGTDIILAANSNETIAKKKKPDNNQSDFKNQDESKMASMVSFFGAMANQLNYEVQADDGKSYGALSYAFSKAVYSISADASYQQLFDRIRLIIQMNAVNQIPEASGILAQPVLGGQYLGIPNYFTVKEWQDNNTVIIEAGFLNGVSPGTVVGFYPPEMRTEQNATPFAVGTVKESGSVNSIVVVPDGISKDSAILAWVIVKEENFGTLKIRLQLKGDFSTIDTAILNELFSLRYIEKVDSNPDVVIIAEDKKLTLVNPTDLEIAKFSSSSSRSDLLYSLKLSLTQFGQSQYLRKLTQENKQIALQFEFELISRNGISLPDSVTQDSIKDELNNLRIKVGDIVKLKVTNLGSKPAYFTILDIQPDNKTGVLFPRENESPSDYFVKPGEQFVTSSIIFRPPLGQELFKLIATKNPVNLRPLNQRRSVSGKPENSNDPFEILIRQSYYNSETETRSGITSNVPAGSVNIYSVPFLIER